MTAKEKSAFEKEKTLKKQEFFAARNKKKRKPNTAKSNWRNK